MQKGKWPALLVLLLAAAMLVGCGRRREVAEEGDGGKDGEETAAAGPAVAVDVAGGATVTGKISFSGEKPKAVQIRMDADADCSKMHSGPVFVDEVTVNDNGTLRNVIVYVKDGLTKNYKPLADKGHLTQKGCLYEPHVLGVVAGQDLEINNEDSTTHNIHPMPKANREWNQSQPSKGEPLEKPFQQAEFPPIPVKCNIHPWMKSYIAVFKHPFFSVSSKDGTFEIKGLPPGNYTIEAWHEKLGAKEQKVTVAAKDSKSVDFAF